MLGEQATQSKKYSKKYIQMSEKDKSNITQFQLKILGTKLS